MTEEKTISRKPKKRIIKIAKKPPTPAPKPAPVPKPKKAEKPAPAPKPKAQKKQKQQPQKKLTDFARWRKTVKSDEERYQRWVDILCEHSIAWREKRPLKIGVRPEIFTLLDQHITPEYTYLYKGHNHGTTALFKLHFESEEYLRNLIKGGPRYELDGTVNGEITEVQQVNAQTMLDELLAKKDEEAI